MKVIYHARTDTLHVVLKDDKPVHESDEEKSGLFLIMMRKATGSPLRFLTLPNA